ncbi:hypothetical protein V6N12_068749 [Hibiscus sabdariffa]|uniref:Endonuclease/exonuclease/phosphatase domain-containing protein n=1 Tax=Hibiscus sabdariffa TaxID=183260 RepID=A0ABR2FR92_9ROSI
MNWFTMFLNVRGLGRAEKIRVVVKVIVKCRARIVFIQESKLNVVKPWVAKRLKASLHGGLEFFSIQVPVVLGGDFNVVKKEEKKLGASVNNGTMVDFGDFIQRHCLIDIPMTGGLYTWFKGNSEVVASRLDRFLLSPEVFSLVPKVGLSALPRS